MPALEVSGIKKSFGEVTAVNGVSFTVPHGSFTTILGPSGCGKTTTLRMLAGLERPDSGEIRIGGHVVSSSDDRVFVPIEKRDVGMVFQSYALWPHMTVFEQVAYPLRVRRMKKAQIREKVLSTLELVQLTKQQDRHPAEISGGQQQRVALARALVFDPAVLFLDEPLSNLDAALRDRMCLRIARLHQQTGITMVYVTHDQSEALSLSDQIVLLHQGNVIDIGAPSRIYDQPVSFDDSGFVGAGNVISGQLIRVDGRYVQIRMADGSLLRARCAGAGQWHLGRPALGLIRPEDIRVVEPGETAPTENVIRGTIRQSVYVGSHYRLFVGVGDAELRITVPKQWQGPMDETSRDIALHISPDAIQVQAADDLSGDAAPEHGDASGRTGGTDNDQVADSSTAVSTR
jgi:iron(III) transport system ATP-binding protein